MEDQQEKSQVGKFMLKIYFDSLIKNGLIERKVIHSEYTNYCTEHGFVRTDKLGSTLRKHGFLLNHQSTDHFKINLKSVSLFQNKILSEWDEVRINGVLKNLLVTELTEQNESKYDVDDTEEFLLYQKTKEINVDNNFFPTNMCCYMCQKNFTKQSDYEEHIQYHGNDTDFKCLETFTECEPKFTISYKVCLNSYQINMLFKTKEKNVVIHKILVIQSRTVLNIKGHKGSYNMPKDGVDSFYVDRHIFLVGSEQPVVIIYSLQGNTKVHIIEQHHFMRSEDFLAVSGFKIRSTLVPERRERKKRKELPQFHADAEIKKLLPTGFLEKDLCLLKENYRSYFTTNKLTMENYVDVLTLLLQIDDISILNGYSKYTKEKAKIKRFGNEYSVQLDLDKMKNADQSVEETIKPFDEIKLRIISDRNPKTYFCKVHRVYPRTICFKSDEKLPDEATYKITFGPSRMTLRYQRLALWLLYKNPKFFTKLFPNKTFIYSDQSISSFVCNSSLDIVNKSVAKNPEQLQAVRNVVNGAGREIPYIISGPPGTGKTTTLVECILQLRKNDPECKILITAGSNAACDEIARRLCKYLKIHEPDEAVLLRIYSKSAEEKFENVNNDLTEFSNLCHGDHFYPALDIMYTYQIIICTLTVCGNYVNEGIDPNHFTHCFMDECAASTECEAIIAIVSLSPNCKIILAGDTKQLGPVILTKRAESLGLGQSLMDRLLARDCYAIDPITNSYDRRVQTLLLRNFRTHKSILNLSNSLYYSNQLIAAAPKDQTDWCLYWYQLPKENFPIIFNDTNGRCYKPESCKSFQNDQEIDKVIDYVKRLLCFGIRGRIVKEEDIGVLSPYKRQYQRIRELLNQRKLYKVETGSAEIFQGKEKPIIIISMVRSRTSQVGFLDNPRRLNVMLTRAQSLLIIIGNSQTLKKIPDFQKVIEYCENNEAFIHSYCTPRRDQNIDNDRSNKNKVKSLQNDNVLKETENLVYDFLKGNQNFRSQYTKETINSTNDKINDQLNNFFSELNTNCDKIGCSSNKKIFFNNNNLSVSTLQTFNSQSTKVLVSPKHAVKINNEVDPRDLLKDRSSNAPIIERENDQVNKKIEAKNISNFRRSNVPQITTQRTFDHSNNRVEAKSHLTQPQPLDYASNECSRIFSRATPIAIKQEKSKKNCILS